jgi:hypothetical protein
LKRHSGPDPIQHASATDLEVLDGAFGFQNFALGGELCDSDQARRGRIAEQHDLIFAFYSPLVKCVF